MHDADTTKWNGDSGHAQWQSDMTSCGTKCLGKGSCVTSCMSGKGWSSGCATCFGNLADCTSKNCLAKCIGGRTPGCVTCLKAADATQPRLVLARAQVSTRQALRPRWHCHLNAMMP